MSETASFGYPAVDAAEMAGMVLAVALIGAGAPYVSLQQRARRRLRRGAPQ